MHVIQTKGYLQKTEKTPKIWHHQDFLLNGTSCIFKLFEPLLSNEFIRWQSKDPLVVV